MKLILPQDASQRRNRGLQLAQEGNAAGRPELRIALLSSFNVDLLAALVGESLGRRGVFASVETAGFGQLEAEILNPESALYTQPPDSILLVLAVEDLLPLLFERPAALTAADQQALVEEQIERIRGLTSTLLERLPAAIVSLALTGPARPPSERVLSPAAPERGESAIRAFTAAVGQLASDRLLVLPWEAAANRVGTDNLGDTRLWYLARMRLNPAALALLADVYARAMAAFRGAARKVAVVDLDNTLWGGVVGEAGVSGIALGGEGIGFAFQEFQRELLRLRDSGTVLAVASKNNPEDVAEVFDTHRGMVLKREHFGAMRVNWQDKATNLQEIAEELNLGLDSFVFLDDNPVERSWITSALPMVIVPDLPDDPAAWVGFLRDLDYFDRIQLTEADFKRAETYRIQGQRRELRERAASLEDFLASLQQTVTIQPLNEASLGRAAQMCQRTNQFNLTTRRYTVADLDAMQRDPDIEVFVLSVKDRFGDSGITGLAVLRFAGDAAEIDTLLLSCRVLGRRIEDAFLAFLAERARTRGARALKGRYLPTPKNAQVARFYPVRGFAETGENVYEFPLDGEAAAFPPEISLEVLVDA